MQSLYVARVEFRDVLVIPRSYWSMILTVVYEGCGHLGSDKVSAMVERPFICPIMYKEICAHVRGSDVCQRKGKNKPTKAQMVDRT